MTFRTPILCIMLLGLSVSCHEKRVSQTEYEKDDLTALASKVSHCSRLYTTEYTIRKIVTFNDEVRIKGSLFSKQIDVKLSMGDRKVAIPMTVTLKGYIDFSSFSSKNVSRSKGRIVLTLPNPQITVSASRIDHKNMRKYVSLTRANFSADEIEKYQRQGVDSILSHLNEMGIAEQARQNAVNTLLPLLMQLGYHDDQVVIRFRSDINDKTLLDWINIEKVRSEK